MINIDAIHRGMPVMTSDRQRLGTVREVQGRVIRLDEAAGGVSGGSASVPLEWVLAVDDAVHLAKSREQAERDLTP